MYDKEENTLWIGTQRNGISVFDCTTQQFKNYTAEDGLATNDVTHLSPAADGGIWIAHYHVGIDYNDRKSKRFTLFKAMSSRSWCAVDQKKNVWVGTDHGLALFNPQTEEFIHFRHDPANAGSLIADHVHSIREMKDGKPENIKHYRQNLL